MGDQLRQRRGAQAFPATLAEAAPVVADCLARLDDIHHLVISVAGTARFVQFAAFGPNLRAESVGNTYLRGRGRLEVKELAWLAEHGWNHPDEGRNHWRHWEPADHSAAATTALVTLHTIHGAGHAAELEFSSSDPWVLEAVTGGRA